MQFDNDDNLDYQLNKIASNVIREKRIAKGYSLEDVTNKLDNIITRQSLYRYENNEARMKNKIFKKICLALGENPNAIWNDINNRFVNNLQFDNAEVIDMDSDIVMIPVYGTIKAGIPLESQTDIIEYMRIPKEWTNGGKKLFGLRLSGDSMFPKYQDGETVIFEQTNDLETYKNKDCAVMINHTESTFKKVLVNDKGIVLQPYNTAYDIMMFSNDEMNTLPIAILGVARKKVSDIE